MKTKLGFIVLFIYLSFNTLHSQENVGSREDKGTASERNVTVRLGAFVGVSNNIFLTKNDNGIGPIAGVDIEVLDSVNLRRHALVLRAKQTLETGDTNLRALQFSLNYRLKFIQTPKFDAYVNAKFASYTYAQKDVTIIVENGPADGPTTIVEERKGGDFTAPGAFGIGADYKVGNGYITFNYNDIVAIGINSNDEFPTEFTLGYKFIL